MIVRILIVSLLSYLLTLFSLEFFEQATAVKTPLSNTELNKIDTRQAVDIEVFVRKDCPHCIEAEEFLQVLARERPKLHIVVRDVLLDPAALERLEKIAKTLNVNTVRVPAFYLHGQLIVGFSDAATTGKLIRAELAEAFAKIPQASGSSESCEAEKPLECKPEISASSAKPGIYEFTLLGKTIALEQVGLPLFTLAMGLLDGFNPCSMWVLILMISLLAPMRDRMRMLAVAGVFVVVEGLAYFVFMAAWLNLFFLIGLSRASEVIIACLALLAGTVNLKDFWALGSGISLSIPDSAKPGIYARIRNILQARNLAGAIAGAVLLAIFVQVVELFCTSGFPALYTRILTLRQLNGFSYYGYLLLYNAAYMLDDVIVLAIGIITLSQRRLQEREGRRLKLISGMVMVGLGLYLLMR